MSTFNNEKQEMKENETFVFTALPSNIEELKVRICRE